MTKALLLAGLALAAHGGELAAQRTSSAPTGPGLIAMRAYSCGLANVDSAGALLSGASGAIALELIAEGLLLDHKILERTWGDEWDLVEMYAAADEEELRYAFEEMDLRVFVAPGMQARIDTFESLCPRRKDNQYSVVSSPR